MGTKLQYGMNPLANIPNNEGFSVNTFVDWDYFGNKGVIKEEDTKNRRVLDKFEGSMDRLLQQQNMESIKRTMLVHQDIFQYQVRELHRLYSVQKMLMDEMKNQIVKQDPMITRHGSDTSTYCSDFLNQHQPTTTGYKKTHVHSVTNNNIIRISRERSAGSCSVDQILEPKPLLFDLERPVIEEKDLSPGSLSLYRTKKINEIGKDGCDEAHYGESSDHHVELTLSIGGGGCSGKKKSKSNDDGNLEREEEWCSGLNARMGNSSTATLGDDDRQSKQPHWLFQGLSFNRA